MSDLAQQFDRIQQHGVAPPDFRGLGSKRVDAWLLMTATPELCSFLGRDLLDDKMAAWLTTFGRLRQGASLTDAETEVRSLSLHQLRGITREPLSRELDLAVCVAAGARRAPALCLAAVAV